MQAMPMRFTAPSRPPIHFYLDFVSTYSYFATERIDAMNVFFLSDDESSNDTAASATRTGSLHRN